MQNLLQANASLALTRRSRMRRDRSGAMFAQMVRSERKARRVEILVVRAIHANAQLCLRMHFSTVVLETANRATVAV
jgi:hypothetical protein